MTGRRTEHDRTELLLVFKGTHTTVCPLSVEQSFKQTILRQWAILNDGVLKLVVVIHCRECIIYYGNVKIRNHFRSNTIYRFFYDESANINGYANRTVRIVISTNTKLKCLNI